MATRPRKSSPRADRLARPVRFTATAEMQLADFDGDAPEQVARLVGTSRRRDGRDTHGHTPTGLMRKYNLRGFVVLATFDAEDGFVVYGVTTRERRSSARSVPTVGQLIDPTAILD